MTFIRNVFEGQFHPKFNLSISSVSEVQSFLNRQYKNSNYMDWGSCNELHVAWAFCVYNLFDIAFERTPI